MKFLEKIIDEIIKENPDLTNVNIVLPGKRPIVFIKKILEERNYSGFLPNFFTIEELIISLTSYKFIEGTSLWLFAYKNYQNCDISVKDNFSEFLKWFPTLLKDWDDMLKFSDAGDKAVLEFMFDEERIKEWAQDLGEQDNVPRKKFLNFWRNMNVFIPYLKQKLLNKNWATLGMIHEMAKKEIPNFAQTTTEKYVFCGFNAFTPVEELLVKNLLQQNKVQCFFQADQYYIEDKKQEAGKFIRKYIQWKEFGDFRPFKWIEDDFRKEKNISLYEVSGNITQAKILPNIIEEVGNSDLSDTAIVLLDENLLPATLDAISDIPELNITMGFPLKNLSFSNGIKHLFYLHKQLEKGKTSYYNKDIVNILDEFPKNEKDEIIISQFRSKIEERNIVYLSQKNLKQLLGELSYFNLFQKPATINEFLQQLINFCSNIKWLDLDDIQYENISHFENHFRILLNQIQGYDFEIKVETLEILINQHINSENINFKGEPLSGLQLMGLLETRLLDFENIIMLSVNEGKLPLGNSQNTYLPFDVRKHFDLHTFIESDSIYAYHFYRLIQGSKNIFLSYNALSSGINTGEKSRFITQIEMESKHNIKKYIIENSSEPIYQKPIEIKKTPIVIEQLQEWKNKVSASHLTTYLYNPIDFYLNKILKTSEADEIEEELSIRNYGNLIHYSLQAIYEKFINKILSISDLENAIQEIDKNIDVAILKLNHLPEYYDKGMNFIHKSIAKRVVENILRFDMKLLENGNELKIIDIEKKFENVEFILNENGDKIAFYGYIDRIDELNGKTRIIDYKTGKTKKLDIKINEDNKIDYFFDNDKKQALQLCIYQYVIGNLPGFSNSTSETGIWSFSEVLKGVVPLQFVQCDLSDAMESLKNIVLEILNPKIPFTENKKVIFSNNN